ncbi:MAG: hypothetical protein ACR2MO_08060 [Acidimicrobiales bacterium]
MRLFGKKSSTSAADAEAEAEIRRAAEALGLPVAPDAAAMAWPPPPEPLVEEAVEDTVTVPAEADLAWEESVASEPDASVAAVEDPLPEDTPAGEPARRRVRKTPPRAAESGRRSGAAAATPRARASGRNSGTRRS